MTSHDPAPTDRLRSALADADVSTRLRAAMIAGTSTEAELVPLLVDRCGVEPDFFVRDMLTWALMQQPRERTVPLLRRELTSGRPQAHSQALHTLSKIGVPEAWPWIFPSSLTHPDEEVARAAWRLSVAIVPADQQAALTGVLLSQVGRGDVEIVRSLARAFGELAIKHPSARTGLEDLGVNASTPRVRSHAKAALVLLDNPRADIRVLLGP